MWKTVLSIPRAMFQIIALVGLVIVLGVFLFSDWMLGDNDTGLGL